MTEHAWPWPQGAQATNLLRRYCRARAAKLARRWGLDLADARMAVSCETAMRTILRQSGVPADIVARVRLVKMGDDICLDERALNDIPPAKMILVRANMGNLLGIMP
jgi:hypothetical protein